MKLFLKKSIRPGLLLIKLNIYIYIMDTYHELNSLLGYLSADKLISSVLKKFRKDMA